MFFCLFVFCLFFLCVPPLDSQLIYFGFIRRDASSESVFCTTHFVCPTRPSTFQVRVPMTEGNRNSGAQKSYLCGGDTQPQLHVACDLPALGSTRLASTGEEQVVHEQFHRRIKSKHTFPSDVEPFSLLCLNYFPSCLNSLSWNKHLL